MNSKIGRSSGLESRTLQARRGRMEYRLWESLDRHVWWWALCYALAYSGCVQSRRPGHIQILLWNPHTPAQWFKQARVFVNWIKVQNIVDLRMNRGWTRKFGPVLLLRKTRKLGHNLKSLMGEIRESW